MQEGDEEAAGLLWAPPDPGGRITVAKGFTTLTGAQSEPVHVNPDAVLYVTAQADREAADHPMD